MDLKFGQDRKLKSRKRIENLFAEGSRFSKFPVTAVYFFDRQKPESYKIAVSVPKKKIRKAVERNLIKRRIREAFRLNQHKLKPDCGLEVMFIFTANEPLSFAVIEKSILSLIDSLNSVSADDISA
ncbi:MAG: ribonuclease P protein component [Moheibacter sp.]